MKANQKQIKSHIAGKLTEKGELSAFWDRFEKLNIEHPFSNEVYEEVSTKVSSRFAQIDRSIQDHEKLL